MCKMEFGIQYNSVVQYSAEYFDCKAIWTMNGKHT